MDEGKLTTVRRARRTLAMVLVSSGGASAPRMALVAAAMIGGPPPCRNSARDAAEKWGDGKGSALFLRWGKTAKRAHLVFLYRGQGLGAHGEMPQIHPSSESMFAPKFVTDSIIFGS
jgi:hypothetical protein